MLLPALGLPNILTKPALNVGLKVKSIIFVFCKSKISKGTLRSSPLTYLILLRMQLRKWKQKLSFIAMTATSFLIFNIRGINMRKFYDSGLYQPPFFRKHRIEYNKICARSSKHFVLYLTSTNSLPACPVPKFLRQVSCCTLFSVFPLPWPPFIDTIIIFIQQCLLHEFHL